MLNYMNTNRIKCLSKSVCMTQEQRDILVGAILGDGHLETQNNGRTYRLETEHSIQQKEYVDWLYGKFSNMVLTAPQEKLQKVAGVARKKYWFSTISTGSMRFYAQQFYGNRKKIIPKMINKLVVPISLAVWFMDDGSLKSKFHRARIINTQCFNKDDIGRLQDMLLNKFNVYTTTRKQKDGTQIYIPSSDVEKFISIIKPFIIPSMEYKIKLT